MAIEELDCFILGEEPIAQRCAELLRSRGHRVVGVVTHAAAFRQWAERSGIQVFKKSEYAAYLDLAPVDLLLSITHPNIISPDAISTAKVAALNYHDGPLPRYAGMNCSAWAIHNQEPQHAVVWHHLNAGLDEGCIVDRCDVVLDPRETSVSLNMRNSVLALEGFTRVLDAIESNTLSAIPQSADIARTIYSRHDRPPAMCVIDWSQSAAAADALVRSCDFGPFNNPFGRPKILHYGRAMGVVETRFAQQAVSASSVAGTVLAISAEAIHISCDMGSLQLSRMQSLAGEELLPLEAARYLAIQVGDVLQDIGALTSPQLLQTSKDIASAEPYWVAALGDRTIPNLPFESHAEQPAFKVEIPFPPEFFKAFQGNWVDAQIALFACTLSGLMRQDAFHVGWVDGVMRNAPAYQPWLPLLLPSVPMLAKVDASQGFATLLEQTAFQRLGMSERAPALFDLVGRNAALRTQVDLSEGAVSPVVVRLGNADAFDVAISLVAGCKLMLVVDAKGGRSGYLASAGALSEETLRTLARHMEIVAGKVAMAPASPLSGIDMLDDESRQRQVFEWNATTQPFPQHLRIHDLFEKQVFSQPDAVALVFDGATLTYAEVELRANQMANTLLAHGAGPGTYVAVMVERSFELVITLLGVAKSGAAYLPLDPVYPQDRVRFMLEDAGCKIMVVSDEFRGRASGMETVLSPTALDLQQQSGARPECSSSAEDVCYTIYTSGSTGNPKGVVLTHKAVVNTLDWVNRNFEVGPQDRLLFVTSASFDLSVYDMFGGLGAGASVEIASSPLLQNPEALAKKLTEGGITIWDSAPPALARLASFLKGPVQNSALRLVMMSGDWIPLWLARDLPGIFPGVQVKSLGGATEAAIWSNYFHIKDVDPAWTSIPYGYPIQNARYYILDEYLRPMPPMMPGDLYIAGECLAQGYLNRESLTAERFVADPFHSGQRMYKTGDLAKYWTDGTMEFLGRVDFQVKVRGYRVELGEVETAIRALPGVRDAICTTWVDGSQQNTLVAYVIPTLGATLSPAEIKASLIVGLPQFMVPSFVITLPELPLSGNGKLDRKALPTPDQTSSGSAYVEPTTTLQSSLVEIWQEVLKRKPIGIRDNFFELGGHSLLVVTLMQKLKSNLHISIPLSRIIEQPTIEKLALTLRATDAPAPGDDSLLVKLRGGGRKSIFFIHDGEGETLLYRSLAQLLPEDYTVYGIMPRSLPNIPLADLTVEQMATTYRLEIKAQQPKGPYLLAGLCAGGIIAYEIAAQLEAGGERAERVFIMDAVEPKTRPKSFNTSKRRVTRLLEAFTAATQSPGATAKPRVVAGLWTSVNKIWNAARYEISRIFIQTFTKLRIKLLRGVVDKSKPWPFFVAQLGVRDIFLSARGRYEPHPLNKGRVVVMKAAEGADADEPAFYNIDDPELGWGRVVKSTLQVTDVKGGHSSMLQAPNVKYLAEQFGQELEDVPSPSRYGALL